MFIVVCRDRSDGWLFHLLNSSVIALLFVNTGKVITKEYDDYARDLVAFMVYMGEPAQVERKQIGYAVLIFLFAVMLPLAYFLKKEYWKIIPKF